MAEEYKEQSSEGRASSSSIVQMSSCPNLTLSESVPDPTSLGKCLKETTQLPNGCIRHSIEENGMVKMDDRDFDHDNDETGCKRMVKEDSGLGDSVTGMASQNFQDPDVVSKLGARGTSKDSAISLDTVEFGVKTCEESISSEGSKKVNDITASLSAVSILDNPAETGRGAPNQREGGCEIEYVVYESELQMPDIMRLITKDLSEPYSIYTYRYFIHNWPKLCFLAMQGKKCVGAIVCKLDMHKKMVRRGYIAMLAVDDQYRRRKIGSHLVMKAIKAMVADDCDEVVLETEISNKAALRLYENLGFVRDKRLFRYYLNGVDALRLKLWLR